MAQLPPGPSFFPTTALDHAVAGLGAGTVAVLCMHPLDLIKVKFQVATKSPKGGMGKHIWSALKDIKVKDGWKGLYRGLGPNVAGNASSWGLYFLLYNMLKKNTTGDDPNYRMSAADYLICSAEASAATAVITNPIWVVKVRMFTTHPDSPIAYRGLWHGLTSIVTNEGYKGLWRGTSLALVGVGNGALQFMIYEEMKRWGFARKRKQFAASGREYTTDDDKLTNTWYTLMSGASKLIALTSTYPYQVVRSRIQNNATTHLYPTIPTCIARTWREERFAGFYRGLGTNLVRVIPGTCVTFVVYENIAWLLRRSAVRREDRRNGGTGG
ncbi:hypothetical protein JAAARDRAFT_28748 [Jaapia argillacea MUCL 33604]|uniref:Mitochondrial carrier n=1 Tax=Jaapia argillacea MUCL 33604 TaxID=933084 RepID=A0A067QNF5_9AGAM|nr:hypothetical protein JAAARDRAFT_28748 [Jaapia argillacea MUCL 33604]